MPKASHPQPRSVLDDLGFTPSEALEIRVKADIYRALLPHIREQNLPQAELAARLGLHQSDVSNLLTGHVSKFSVGKLLKLAGKLDLGAEIKLTKLPRAITPKKPTRTRPQAKSHLKTSSFQSTPSIP